MNNFTKLFVCALLLIVGFAYSWTIALIGYGIWAIFNVFLAVQEKNARLAVFQVLADEMDNEKMDN